MLKIMEADSSNRLTDTCMCEFCHLCLCDASSVEPNHLSYKRPCDLPGKRENRHPIHIFNEKIFKRHCVYNELIGVRMTSVRLKINIK